MTPEKGADFRKQLNAPQQAADHLARAVEKGIDNEFIRWAEWFGERISAQDLAGRKLKVTASQIRNIYGTVKRLEMEPTVDLAQVLLLKPRVKYVQARDKGLGELADELCGAIDAIDRGANDQEKQERFRRFAQGFEAILAYHRVAVENKTGQRRNET